MYNYSPIDRIFFPTLKPLDRRLQYIHLNEMPPYPCWCSRRQTAEPYTTPQTERWNAYRYLLELRCVTTREERPTYQHSSDHHKICEDCYQSLSHDLKVKYLILFPHHLVHMDSICNQMTCRGCSRVMMVAKSPEECYGCLVEYRHVNEHGKAQLDKGWGIPVASFWCRCDLVRETEV